MCVLQGCCAAIQQAELSGDPAQGGTPRACAPSAATRARRRASCAPAAAHGQRARRLAQGHPYRNVCDLRSGAATSLVELEFASHTPAEADKSARVPSGLPYYSISARMSELDVVFLNRFLMARARRRPAPPKP
jgi:hypothetical protein